MLAYTYSPSPGPLLLIHPKSGQLDTHLWNAWLRHDPVRRSAHDLVALRQLQRIYLAGGTLLPTYSDLGARALNTELLSIGAPVHHDELSVAHDVILYLTPALDHLLTETSGHVK